MAIRFDASGDVLSRANLTGAQTVMGWFYISTDRNNYSAFIAINDNNILATASDGTTLLHWDGSNEETGSALSVGTWVHLAITMPNTTNGTTTQVYLNGVLDFSPVLSAAASGSTLYIGNDVASEWLNGRAAYIKIWNRQLSAAEVAAEVWSEDPQSLNSLWLYARLLDATDYNDLSGNARNFTAGGTLTREDGPPGVGWTAPSIFLLPAPAGGGVTVDLSGSPSATIAATINPTVVLGSLSITSATSDSRALIVDPTTVLGSLSITPTANSAIATTVNPVVSISDLVITPAASATIATTVDPTVVLGSLALTPATSDSRALTVDPTTVLGSLSITPTANSAIATTVNPTVVIGAITLTPTANSSKAKTVQPVVYPQFGIRFYGTGSGRVDRVVIPLTTAGDTIATPANVGSGSFTYDLWLRCLYANNSTTATDVRDSNIVLDRDIWNDSRGHCPLGVTRSGGNLVAIFGAHNGTGSWPAIIGTTNIGDGAWHHVAVTRNQSTGQIRIWVDGTQDASGTFSTANWQYPPGLADPGGQDNEYLVVGCEKHDVGFAFNGEIDELRISDSVRYTGTFTPPSGPHLSDDNTVSLYHVDAGTGTTFHDSAEVTGTPTNGTLLVGGANNGPTWTLVGKWGGILIESTGINTARAATVNPTVSIGDIVVAPAASSTIATTVNPTVVLGSLSITPTASSAIAATVDPTVIYGSVAVTPATSDSRALTVDPTLVFGSTTAAPTPSDSIAATVDPTVIYGSVAVTPATSDSRALTVDPTYIAGSLSITPTASSAIAITVDPTVVLGSVAVTPATSDSRALTVDPAVSGGSVTFAPDPSASVATTVNPTVVLGSMSVTPITSDSIATTVNPTVSISDLVITPTASSTIAATVDPTIVLGSLALTPTTSDARTATVDPTVVLGSLSITPITSDARTATVDPTTIQGSILIPPGINSSIATTVDPTVVLGSMVVVPSANTAVATTVNPTVSEGGLTLTPASSDVIITTINPTVVLGSIVLIPSSSDARLATLEPTVVLGSTTAVPSPSLVVVTTIAPNVVLGSIFHLSSGTVKGSNAVGTVTSPESASTVEGV